MKNRNGTSEINDEFSCIDSCNYNLLLLGSIEKGEGLVGPVCRVRSAREWIYSSRSRREDASIVHSNGQAYAHLTWNYIPLYYLYHG